MVQSALRAAAGHAETLRFEHTSKHTCLPRSFLMMTATASSSSSGGPLHTALTGSPCSLTLLVPGVGTTPGSACCWPSGLLLLLPACVAAAAAALAC
jgi:hypothetical protein